ncbi:MAG: cytidylate kinase-like family protein [Anaerolineae bacterium]|nr:cytidylate kinase-like family protein [Anaerolineae bacterium]
MGIVITVSRQLGSNGSYMATEAAEELGFSYLDREILQRAAEEAGDPDEGMVEALSRQERVPGFLERLLDSFGRYSAVPMTPSASLRQGQAYVEVLDAMMAAEMVNSQRRETAAANYGDLVRDVVLNLAETGNVVIAGRGGQAILRNRRNALHVRVFASPETRIRNLMARQSIPRDEAESSILESDRYRARYLQHYHGVNLENPLLYHLMINSDGVSVALGAQLIVTAAHWLQETTRE